MKKILSVCFALTTLCVWADSSAPIVGTWKGYCTPINPSSGRLCNYTIKDNGTGIYNCDFYSDLRCEKETSKKTQLKFKYYAETNKNTKIVFEDGYEVTSQFKVNGDILRETGIKVKSPGKEPFTSKVGPVEFTRVH